MIPKIIHYCWFGNKSLPKESEEFLKTWIKYFPDHQLMLWNEENSPMNHPYLSKAYELKNWANLSNFVRLYALKKYGGWYFDTDIEVVKSPDFSKYKESCFLGIESEWWENNAIVNNAVIAAEAAHPFISNCLDELEHTYDGSELANLSSPMLTTKLLMKRGFKGKPGAIDDIRIFPKSFFYPSSLYDQDHRSKITPNTLTVHYYEADWLNFDTMPSTEVKRMFKDMTRYKLGLRRYRMGKLTVREWISINLRYFKSLFF